MGGRTSEAPSKDLFRPPGACAQQRISPPLLGSYGLLPALLHGRTLPTAQPPYFKSFRLLLTGPAVLGDNIDFQIGIEETEKDFISFLNSILLSSWLTMLSKTTAENTFL